MQVLPDAIQPPSPNHPFGTDNFGRDILSRLIYGARISLFVGLMSQALAVTIGVTLGALAGYFRGWVDDAVLWLVNVVWSFPFLLFAIASRRDLGPSIRNVFLAVGLASVGWAIARVVRDSSSRSTRRVRRGRSRARFSAARIIVRHILRTPWPRTVW